MLGRRLEGWWGSEVRSCGEQAKFDQGIIAAVNKLRKERQI
jgi:hypothetical protein